MGVGVVGEDPPPQAERPNTSTVARRAWAQAWRLSPGRWWGAWAT